MIQTIKLTPKNVFWSKKNIDNQIDVTKNHEKYQKLIAASTLQEQKGFKNLKTDQRGLYLGNEDYVKAITDGYPINQDWKPVCEYYLGLK